MCGRNLLAVPTISVFDDKLIVIAPDFVHRAIARSNIMRINTQPISKPTR